MNNLNIEITKEMLEHYVPAFETANENIFVRMQTFFDNAAVTLDHLMGSKADTYMSENTSLLAFIQGYICVSAAYQAIPQLDLVLDETGFGIVSNGNVAPASRERVNALREELRERKSHLWCDILAVLLQTDWKDTKEAETAISSLLYAPSCFSGYLMIEGKKILMEEFAQMRPQILVAEIKLAKVISEDLYKELVKRVRTGVNEAAYGIITTRSMNFLFAALHDLPTKDLRESLVKTVEALADALPEYKNSDVYRARHTKRFENDKDSGIVFFS